MEEILLRKRGNRKNGELFDIMMKDHGKPRIVGNISYYTGNYPDGPDVRVEVKPYYRGKGIAVKEEDALADRLGAHKVYAEINAGNAESEIAHEKGGFNKLGCLWMKEY